MKKAQHNYNNNSLKNAKILRTEMTDCEQILWYYLRAKRFENIKFKRQVPIGNYIVDFLSKENNLIIELDGSQHQLPKQSEYDKVRNDYLKNLGYKIVRFYNNDIIENVDGVLEKIRQFLL